MADKGYYDTEDLYECHEAGITTIIAIPEYKNPDKEIYRKEQFKYAKEENTYLCPGGCILSFSYEDNNGYQHFKNAQACKYCNLKTLCTKSNRREISRHKHAEHAEQNDRDYVGNQDIYRLRQQLSEHPFGTVKRTMGVRQFLSRGLAGVAAEAALIFLAYNLKRLRSIHKNDNKKDEQAIQLIRLFILIMILETFSLILNRKL